MSASASEGAGERRFKAALLEHSILPLAGLALFGKGNNARKSPNYHSPFIPTAPATVSKPSSWPENWVLIWGRLVAPTGWGRSWQNLSNVCEAGEVRAPSLASWEQKSEQCPATHFFTLCFLSPFSSFWGPLPSVLQTGY